MTFNLQKFKQVLEDPSGYLPLTYLRELDPDDERIEDAYGSAIDSLAELKDLQELYFSLDSKGKDSLLELLAAGIAEKTLLEEIKSRPWAYEKEIAKRAWAQQKQKALNTTATNRGRKHSRWGQKKPLTDREKVGA